MDLERLARHYVRDQESEMKGYLEKLREKIADTIENRLRTKQDRLKVEFIEITDKFNHDNPFDFDGIYSQANDMMKENRLLNLLNDGELLETKTYLIMEDAQSLIGLKDVFENARELYQDLAEALIPNPVDNLDAFVEQLKEHHTLRHMLDNLKAQKFNYVKVDAMRFPTYDEASATLRDYFGKLSRKLTSMNKGLAKGNIDLADFYGLKSALKSFKKEMLQEIVSKDKTERQLKRIYELQKGMDEKGIDYRPVIVAHNSRFTHYSVLCPAERHNAVRKAIDRLDPDDVKEAAPDLQSVLIYFDIDSFFSDNRATHSFLKSILADKNIPVHYVQYDSTRIRPYAPENDLLRWRKEIAE